MQIDKYEIKPMHLKKYDKELIERALRFEYKALIKVSSLATNLPEKEIMENFTLEMAKKAMLAYLGLDGIPYKVNEKVTVVFDMNKIETGTIITDRNGVEHKAHSVMLKDIDKLRELLPKIDSIVTINNMLNVDKNSVDEAYNALLELLEMALDESREEIEKYLDAELARKCIKVLLDLPI